MARRKHVEVAVSEFFGSVLEAQDITAINIAAGEAQQKLTLARRSMRGMLWFALAVILLSDLLPIGPLELGLLPDLHIVQWIVGQPYGYEAGRALYHVDPGTPHVLGVALPWGSLF